MENFIKNCEGWIKKYEQSPDNMVKVRDLQLKFEEEIRRDWENLGDLRPFVRDIYWEVSSRYLRMPRLKEFKRVSFSIRGNRD